VAFRPAGQRITYRRSCGPGHVIPCSDPAEQRHTIIGLNHRAAGSENRADDRIRTTASLPDPVFGGEATSLNLSEQRRKAVEACDRACQFTLGDSAAADLANRHAGETTGSVHDRVAAVSNAVSLYLSFGINTVPTRVNRIWASDVDTLNTLALTALMGGELLPQEDALANIRGFLGSDGYKATHAEQPDPNDVYRNLLVDYELVRAPMVFGSPSLPPASTRNPARGFLNIRRELAISLCDTGKLRWGVSDFGVAGLHSEKVMSCILMSARKQSSIDAKFVEVGAAPASDVNGRKLAASTSPTDESRMDRAVQYDDTDRLSLLYDQEFGRHRGF
jgi:hypothetical protein